MPEYQGASILLSRENFGCGSSREHAVWALVQFGIRCVIAPSFADIFKNNAFKSGLLPLELDENTIDALFEQATSDGGVALTVNLESLNTKEQAAPSYLMYSAAFTAASPIFLRKAVVIKGEGVSSVNF